MNLTAKKPFLFSTSSRLLKELSQVWHFSVADHCTRSAKQEQRICKQPKSPKTALSIFVLYQCKCLHRSRVKETSIWIAQVKINFLMLPSLSTLWRTLGKCIKHFYALNVQINCLYIIIWKFYKNICRVQSRLNTIKSCHKQKKTRFLRKKPSRQLPKLFGNRNSFKN